MQQKLCLWLCLLVLFGALCAGNPFLREGAAAALTAPDGDRAPGAAGADAAAASASPVHLALAPRASAPVAGALQALGPIVPVNAAAAAAGKPRGVDAAAPCPDASLQPLVDRVERGRDGEPVWVLRDGRRFARNRHGDAPLLVPVVGAAPGK